MGLVNSLKVRIHFNDSLYLDVFSNSTSYLLDLDIKSEFDNSPEFLIGELSSNLINIKLLNENDLFNPMNTESPYSEFIKEGIKLEVFSGVEPEGTFYVSSWQTPSVFGTRAILITGVDRLQSLLNTPVNLLEFDSSSSVKVILEKILDSLGITSSEYDISADLDMILNYVVVRGANLSSVLNDISKAADCYIYVSKDNKIVAKPKNIVGAYLEKYSTDSDDTITNNGTVLDLNQFFGSTINCNRLKVNYTLVEPSGTSQLKVIKLDLVPGLNDFTAISIDSTIYDIDNIIINNDCIITNLKLMQSTMDISILNNTINNISVDVILYGRTLTMTDSFVIKDDVDDIVSRGLNELVVTSSLIQSKEYASELVDILWARSSYSVPYIKFNLHLTNQSDLQRDLGDILNIVSPSGKVDFIGYIHSMHTFWVNGDTLKIEIVLKYTTVV